jgi:2-polyprenyl-3-methyl-5-hydroxy-6-metoxy-1,4-benzoquinol methylase
MRCVTCDADVSLDGPWPPHRDGARRCGQCGRVYPVRSGIVMLGERPTNDMPDDFYDLLAEIEPRHFWFGARNRFILSVLREVTGQRASMTVLDVGCGTGFVTAAIERAGMAVCGIDMHEVGLSFARPRMRGPLVCATAMSLPFRDQFDVAMLCDVIEHCPDDVAVLRNARGAVRPGGAILITVPAHHVLWTTVDDISGHKRRYDASMLRAAIEEAGLGVRLIRYFNSLLLPIQLLQRLGMREQPTATYEDRERIARQSLTLPPAPLNRLLADLLSADLLVSRLPMTVGTSLIAVAERR